MLADWTQYVTLAVPGHPASPDHTASPKVQLIASCKCFCDSTISVPKCHPASPSVCQFVQTLRMFSTGVCSERNQCVKFCQQLGLALSLQPVAPFCHLVTHNSNKKEFCHLVAHNSSKKGICHLVTPLPLGWHNTGKHYGCSHGEPTSCSWAFIHVQLCLSYQSILQADKYNNLSVQSLLV